MIEGSSDCVTLLDLRGHIHYLNPAGARLLELALPHDLIERSWIDLWEGAHRVTATNAFARGAAGERTTFEGFCRTAAGVGKWWEVAITPVVDEHGEVAQMLVVSRDITSRRREAALRTGHRELLEMIATGASLESVIDRLVQLAENQTDGMLCSVLLLDDDGVHARTFAAPSLPDAYNKAIDGIAIGPRIGSCGTAMYFARQVIVTDVLTDPHWEDYRELAAAHGLRACWSTPVLSSHKKVLGSFAMYYAEPRGPSTEELRLIDAAANICGIAIEHQRAQEALRRSEARTRAMLRAIPDWMFILDQDGVFVDYHDNHHHQLPVQPETFLGKTFSDVLSSRVARALAEAIARVRASDEPVTFEYSTRAGGADAFYEACVVQCDGDRILSIVRDITDRKRAEMDAAVQRRELAHLSRVAMLGELSGAIAHELSQPLAAILSNAQAAYRLAGAVPIDRPELQEALSDIVASDRRASAVIERLRALLKKGEGVIEPIDMHELTREVLDLAHSDLLARRVVVTTELTAANATVHGDRVQLQQVLLNLVLNGCEAMSDAADGDRRLLISTTLDDRWVRLAVSDRGVGIAADMLDAVFEPFVTFKENGLGLGLSISRTIVNAHGGRILAENNAEHGATFRCYLPVATPD